MAELQPAAGSAVALPADATSSADSEVAKRLKEFVAYVGSHAYSREQAVALLQLAVDTAEPGPAKKSIRLEWRNIYAAIATLTRTDSETLHARLTIGFSPAEFKWMLQNKALYTWHSSPVRYQRCLQCMVAKLGQCGSNAEKTCWSCRSRLTDAPPGQLASTGNALRPPRNIALTMAKTAAKQPIGPPELDAHISMYEPAKWPLTKRDQTYLSQANKFWNFISTDAFLGITDRSQLVDLTHRACTKRYILYMHKMKKRENVRAAVDLHCLGLSPSQSQVQPEGTQHSGAVEPELEQRLSGESGAAAAVGGGAGAEQRQALQALGPEAAGHLALGTLSGSQFSGEPSSFSDVPESPLGAAAARRSSRLRPGFAPSSSAMHSDLPESELPPSAGNHDWVNPSDELLATLLEELDLDLRDAPDDSDEGAGEAGPARKCRPWHWLQEMRRFGYERQVMPKDQKKKRKRPLAASGSGLGSGAATSSQTAPQDIAQAVRRQPRRRAQQQYSLDSDSSDANSPAEQEESAEEDAPAEPIRRQRSARVNQRPLQSLQPPSPPPPLQGPDPKPNPSGLFQSSGLGSASRSGFSSREAHTNENLQSAPGTEGLGLSPLGPGAFAAGVSPAPFGDSLIFPRAGNLDLRQMGGPGSSPVQVGPPGRGRAGQGSPAAAVASLDLPYDMPYASRGSTAFVGSIDRSAFSLDIDLPPLQGNTQGPSNSLQQRYFPSTHTAASDPLFSHALPQGLQLGQGWAPVEQGRHSQRRQSPFGQLLPQRSAPPTFGRGGSFSQDPQATSLYQLAHGDNQRSSVFGHGDHQRNQGMHPMGQLEQHYLTHRQPAHSASGSLLGPGSRPPSLQPLTGGLEWLEPHAQHLRQHGTLARLGQASPFDPNMQVAVNLDELSALMQAERSQATPAPPQPRVHMTAAQTYLSNAAGHQYARPSMTLAQSYLTQLRAQHTYTHGLPNYCDGSTVDPAWGRSNPSSEWGNMQMPQHRVQGLHRLRDPALSASEPRHDSHLEMPVPGNDRDALNEAQIDPSLLHRH